MTKYNDFETMFTDLQNDIEECLMYEVTDEVKLLLEKSVEENVYAVYQPTTYVRRGDNANDTEGLAHAFMPKKITNGVEIWSSVRPNWNYSGSEGWSGENWMGDNISDIVQSGEGYTWSRSGIYLKEKAGNPLRRPFMKPVQDLLNMGRSDVLIREALTTRGWSCEGWW